MLFDRPSDDDPIPWITAYIWFPSRSASASRFIANIARPSPRIVPSARSENGLQSLVGDNAGVFEKQTNIEMSLNVSTPPVITRSELPNCSSLAAIDSAESELAHAASVTQFVPPRLNLLAIRPA